MEIICIDDCSPDNSAEIVKKFAEKDNRIKYIKHPVNKKLGGTRNTGINVATGKYIAFIDSNDYLLDNDCYKNAIDSLEKYDVDISIFSYLGYYENKKVNYYFKKNITGIHKLNSNNFNKILCVAWNKIFKLDDIKKYNLYFPEQVRFEDNAFWYKYIASVEPKAYIYNNICYAYRQHNESVMANKDKYVYDFIDIVLDINTYLEKIDKKDYFKNEYVAMLYNPATSDNIFELNDNEIKTIADKFANCIKKLGLTSEDKAICLFYK